MCENIGKKSTVTIETLYAAFDWEAMHKNTVLKKVLCTCFVNMCTCILWTD